MPDEGLATLLAVLSIFRTPLTKPGYAKFLVLAAGWILTQAPLHAVTEALVVTGVSGVRHWEAYHRFFSRGTWDPDRLGWYLFCELKKLVPDGALRLVIDDTLCSKKGANVFGIGSHIDPVRSTKRHKSFCFGHVWVVLGLMVRVPFSDRLWTLPLLFRLYRTRRTAQEDYSKKTELAREMLLVLLSWIEPREGQPHPFRVSVALDQGYAVSTVLHGLQERVTFFGAMRADAALTSPVIHDLTPSKKRKGTRLPTPKQLAEDESTPWSCVHATIYGRLQPVMYKALTAQWYSVCGEATLSIVIVHCPSGALPVRVFFSTNPFESVRMVLENYSYRWTIEWCFRNMKQLMGLSDSQAWKEESVRRVAPWIGLLYSALVLWFVRIHPTELAALPVRPWYVTKTGLCFADILRAARRALTGVDILAIAENMGTLPRARRAEPEEAQLPLPFAA
jgi:hypothetical protein